MQLSSSITGFPRLPPSSCAVVKLGQLPNFHPWFSLVWTSVSFTHWFLLLVLHIAMRSSPLPQRISITVTVCVATLPQPLAPSVIVTLYVNGTHPPVVVTSMLPSLAPLQLTLKPHSYSDREPMEIIGVGSTLIVCIKRILFQH